MLGKRTARSALCSSLVLAALLVSSRAEAASVSFVIDLDFPFAPTPGSALGIQGTFVEAARFDVDSALLPSGTISFVPYARLDAFSVSLPVLSVGQGEKNGGTCLSMNRPPCGILFLGGEPVSLVGQFSIPGAGGQFNFRFDNTGPGFLSPDAIFQSVSIEDLSAPFRQTVASGFATIRPVPEPVSMLLFLAGGAAVGRALRRRDGSRATRA